MKYDSRSRIVSYRIRLSLSHTRTLPVEMRFTRRFRQPPPPPPPPPPPQPQSSSATKLLPTYVRHLIVVNHRATTPVITRLHIFISCSAGGCGCGYCRRSFTPHAAATAAAAAAAAVSLSTTRQSPSLPLRYPFATTAPHRTAPPAANNAPTRNNI